LAWLLEEVWVAVMRFAYADPPYYLQGKRLYGKHHDDASVWDDQQTHFDLVQRLCDDYSDGWALSCNPADLRWLYPATPDGTRVCVYAKTFHQIRNKVSVQYAWEPLLLFGGRPQVEQRVMCRDWAPIAAIPKVRGLVGAKPVKFCEWVLDLLNFDPQQDEIDDLFPGTGVMSTVVEETKAAWL
jgi:hypothetical protein